MESTLASDTHRHEGFAVGADDYVTKPFKAEDLLDRVRVWAQTRRRLKSAHERLLRQQEQLRELEQRALREQLAQDEAVLVMAYTPLKILVNMLRAWEAGELSAEDATRVRAELQAAASELTTRINTLGTILRSS